MQSFDAKLPSITKWYKRKPPELKQHGLCGIKFSLNHFRICAIIKYFMNIIEI